MEGLTEAEQKFFDSKGEAEVVEPEATVEPEAPAEPVQKAEVVVEKKEPSKFTYSKDTDNVVDEHGRKYVPLGAVQEARNENKSLRRELEDLKTKWSGGEQKLAALMQRIENKQEAPDPEKQPIEHLRSKNAELEEKIRALSEAEDQRGKEKETNSQLEEFKQNVVSSERAFAKANPDYAKAVERVHEVWRAEYETAGVPEQLIESMLSRKGAQFSYAALQKEQNPAEAVYKLAQRYGYKKAEKAEQKDESNKDKDKLAQIAKGQEAEKSLAGGKGPSDMSLEALATMSDEEMEAYVADPKNWKKLSKAA